ncbi:MAG: carboxypeptidase regulatory-like domain-containing protein [Ilumatobacter fluminis]|uniref:MSCRAMM family protein n=1 Tax=Ilumatobacter fluminis TaxID=467091 RepID=UPI0032EB9DE3
MDDFGNGIAGVEIVLSGIDVNGDPVSASTTTDANGDYWFTNLLPGAYEVAETQPTGFSDGAEAAGSTGGDISTNDVIADIPLARGQDSVDNDFAEYRPSGIAGSVVDQDDVGIADVTLTLTGTDVNGDPVSLTTTTDADGNYLFGDLLPGTYTVTETHPSGYLDGHEEAGSTGGDISTNDVIADIPLQANESSYGHDFHEFVPASIEGSVFVDGDGEPIAGVVITLTGTDVNGDPVEIATTTDTDGDYSFADLLPGSYVVTETQPDGYGAGAVTPNNSISIELSGGDESTDNDFSESTGSISGTVTDDQGRPLVDVEITLTGTDVNGVDIELVTTTNSTGDYVFGDMVGGDYTVTETQPDGYGPGVSAAGSTGGDDGVNDIVGIELPGGVDSVDNDFVEETSTVSGVVRDDDGNPIAGVDVSLNGTDVNGDLVAQSTTTGSDGSYVFPGIVAGSYTISQTQPNGYSSVIAIPGSTGGSVDGTDIITSVTVGDGEDSEDNDFVETRTATRTVTERELPLTGGSAGDLARVAMLLALIGGPLLLAGRRRREGDIA